VIGLSRLRVKGHVEALRNLLGLRIQGPEQEAISLGTRQGVGIDIADAGAFEPVAPDEVPGVSMASRLAIDEAFHVAQELLAAVIDESQGELGGDVLVSRDDVLEQQLLERRHLGTSTEKRYPDVRGYADQPPTRFRCDELEDRAELYWLARRRAARSRRSARRPSSTIWVFVTAALSPRATASSSRAFDARRSSSSSRSKVVRTLHRGSYASYAAVKKDLPEATN
jgi:hypothetical protein